MPVDLGLDNHIAAVTKKDASGFRTNTEALLEQAFKADRNPFGEGATIAATDLEAVLTGQIMEFAGARAPAEFLECNGAEVRRSSYPTLYNAIGNTYGTPQSSADFVLPDFSGAAAVGAGGTRVAGPATSVASEWTSDTVTLTSANMPRHRHTVDEDSDEAGLHSHTFTNRISFGFDSGSDRGGGGGNAGAAQQRNWADNTVNNILENNRRTYQNLISDFNLFDRLGFDTSGIRESLQRNHETIQANIRYGDALLEEERRRGDLNQYAPVLLGMPGASYGITTAGATTGVGGAHTHTVGGSVEDAGSATPMSVRQPSLSVMFIIKT